MITPILAALVLSTSPGVYPVDPAPAAASMATCATLDLKANRLADEIARDHGLRWINAPESDFEALDAIYLDAQADRDPRAEQAAALWDLAETLGCYPEE